jgi:peptidoglycan/LPS O-acetylase OafA/YrhL
MTSSGSKQQRLVIGQSLIVAGLFLQASIALKLLTPDHLSHEVAQRLLGVMMGALVAFYANAAPKTLPSPTCRRLEAEQRIRRFAGWALTLGGVGFALASAWAPFEDQRAIAVSLLGSCLVLVILRIVGDRSELFSPPSPGRTQEDDKA